MSSIEEAARSYYINNGAWPGVKSGNPLGDLTSGNYLPASWRAINPSDFLQPLLPIIVTTFLQMLPH